jgi:GTP-binding protein
MVKIKFIKKMPLGLLVETKRLEKFCSKATDGEKQFCLEVVRRFGNWHFKVLQTKTRPQPGLPGSEMDAILELKVLTDVGFSRVFKLDKPIVCLTSAKPKVLITRLL